MLKIRCEITTIGVILFGFIISSIFADSLSPDDTEMLQIFGVDVLVLENGNFHKTEKYDIMQRKKGLVIRRGQDFYLNLKLNRDYNRSTDGVALRLNAESESNIFNITDNTPEISISLENSTEPGKTSASLDTIGIQSIKIKMFLPANFRIAKYRLRIETNTTSIPNRAANFKINELLYIIFNPWCPDDDVFLNNDEFRQEYVLSEFGLVWSGDAGQMEPLPWAFRQFNKDILDCAFYLINAKSKVDIINRGSPIHITRALSALINVEDGGILEGKWEGSYEDGVPPSAWVGSSDIIQKYYKEKKTVKYGQCWVFGGVLATLSRALGIPTRIVTNFQSAHDTNGNLRMERCIDSEGNRVQDDELTGDSMWAFHVWNEVWMRRKDLRNKLYDGWQVVDSTPQEVSNDDGGYRGQLACGPIPVLAIKLGDLDIPYDAKFVFAEVNADKYYFKKRNIDDKKMFDRVDQHDVGQYISTKAVGSNQREDITDTYKFPENSIENRYSFYNARSSCEDAIAIEIAGPVKNFNSIKFNLVATKNVKIGQPLSIVLSMENESNKTHNVSTKLTFNVYEYTLTKIGHVNQTKANVSIGPNQSKIVQLDISWDDYREIMMSKSIFKIICLCSVPEENFEYFAELDFSLIKPGIQIYAKELVAVDKKIEATINFTNPLPIKLTNGQFQVSAPGLEKILEIKLNDIVEPHAVVTSHFTSIPKREEYSSIFVNFESTELNKIMGTLPVEVVTNYPSLRSTTIDTSPDDVDASADDVDASYQLVDVD